MTDISSYLGAVAHSFNPSYSACWGRRTKKGWGICARSRTVWSSHSISPHPYPSSAAWDDHRAGRGTKTGGSVGLGLPPPREGCHNIIMEGSSAPSPQCQSQNKQTHWGGGASSSAACLITREAWHSYWSKQVNFSLVSFDEWFLFPPFPQYTRFFLFKVWACGLTIVFWISRRMAAIWLRSWRVWTLEFLGSWTLGNAFLLLGLGGTALGLCVQSPGAAGFRTLQSWRCLWCLLPWMWDVRLGCLLSFLSFPPGYL